MLKTLSQALERVRLGSFGECAACGGGIERKAAGSDSVGAVLCQMSGSKGAGLTFGDSTSRPRYSRHGERMDRTAHRVSCCPIILRLYPVLPSAALCGLRGSIVALKRLQANYETLRDALRGNAIPAKHVYRRCSARYPLVLAWLIAACRLGKAWSLSTS